MRVVAPDQGREPAKAEGMEYFELIKAINNRLASHW